ncbi:MAG: hypothetical protein DHS80DRAFT_25805 [Piptocephalis tieghemiana]|nr:MAG: hypothetical protein DHS80DRAFT_25805 [Piptocephalis tieghemiana]
MDAVRSGSQAVIDSVLSSSSPPPATLPPGSPNPHVRAAAVDTPPEDDLEEVDDEGDEGDEDDWVTQTSSEQPSTEAADASPTSTSNSTTPQPSPSPAPLHMADSNGESNSPLILVDFSCSPTVTRGKEDLCTKVQKAYESAGRRLAQLLQIKSPLRLKLSYKSFCDTDWGCGSSTLGQAWAASYWEVGGKEGLDSAFLYPQALLKQLGLNSNTMNNFDIIAQFNADQRKRYWFDGDNKDNKPKKGQYEFEYLAIHELMHGLGYTTSLAQRDGRSLVTPGTLVDGRNITMAFRKPYLFDRHIFFPNIQASLPSLIPSLAPTAPYNASLTTDSAWWADYASRPEGQVASLLYTQATSGDGSAVLQIDPTNASIPAIQLAQGNITLATLYTPSGNFERASSLMHLSAPLTPPQDYLMLPQAIKGRVLDTKDGLVGGVFGPITVRMLSALGYPLLEPVIYRDHTVASGSILQRQEGIMCALVGMVILSVW